VPLANKSESSPSILSWFKLFSFSSDQDPNIGRILSLLNIKSIAKRLSLNFSDVTNKGFTYEHIWSVNTPSLTFTSK
jgi:hypothetical protein